MQTDGREIVKIPQSLAYLASISSLMNVFKQKHTQLEMTKTTSENERLQAILKRKIQLLYTRTHTNTNTHACLLTSLYISANKTKQKKANAITQCNHQHNKKEHIGKHIINE